MAIPALIAAGASIAGGLLQSAGQRSVNRTNLRIAEMQNRLNYQMMQEQNQFNLQQWHRQNEYNTPLAQRLRYENAGINPYLALGNIQSGNTQSLTSATPAPAVGASMQNEMLGLGSGIQNAGSLASNALIQKEQLKIQEKLANAEIDNKSEDTKGRSIDNKYKDRQNQANLDQTEAGTKSILGKLAIDTRLSFAQEDHIRQQINAITTDIELKQVVKEMNLYQLKHLLPAQRQALAVGMAEAYQRMKLMTQQGLVAEAQAKLLYAQELDTLERTAGVKIDNKYKDDILSTMVNKTKQEIQNLKKMNVKVDHDMTMDKLNQVWQGISVIQRQQEIGVKALDALVPM